jgi:hypothetical protein
MTTYEIKIELAKNEIKACENMVKLAEQAHTKSVARYLELLEQDPAIKEKKQSMVYQGSFVPFSATNYVINNVIAKSVMNLASRDFGYNIDIRFLRAYFTWEQISDMHATLSAGIPIKLVDNATMKVLTTPNEPMLFKRVSGCVKFLESVDNEPIAQAVRELMQKRYGNPYSARYLQNNFTKIQLLDMVGELLNGRLFNVEISNS